MKKNLFCFVLLALSFVNNTNVYSQNIGLDWVTQVTGTSLYSSGVGSSITLDNSGNVFTTGSFTQTVDFDPGPGTNYLTSAGNGDLFISKQDPDGNLIWVKGMGGTMNDGGLFIRSDTSGNVYITGSFSETVDFDPGPGTSNFTATGMTDIFILKLDANGDFIWVKTLEGTGYNAGICLTLNNSGDIYITGIFQETVDFDPGPGTNNLTSAGYNDFFVLKLDTNGNLIWIKTIGGANADDVTSITTDVSGNIYVSGDFTETVDFDPGSGTNSLNSYALTMDAFILKLDENGNFIWVKRMGGSELCREAALTVVTDPAGNIYSSGIFGGTGDFNPGTGTFNLTPVGNEDVFILKLDVNGNFVWAKKIGGAEYEHTFSTDVNASGNLYVSGIFQETVDFNPGFGVFNLTSNGFYDSYISKFDTNGNFVWARSFGGTDWDAVNGIDLDGYENIYAAGFFRETVDFNPGAGTLNLTSASVGGDGFVLKLTSCSASYGTDTITACGSYTWIDGNTYPSSTNTPTFTLANSTNCDSVVTLNLTIIPLATSNVSETACNSFTWTNGNGQTYLTSTTATHIIPNGASNGCDSVITLNLTVKEVDTAISINGVELTSNQGNASSYQWVDCNNGNSPIPGATTQTFTPTTNGNYAVIITANSCTETSGCILVTTVGIESLEYNSNWKIYPNPASDNLFIEVEEKRTVQLVDVFGKTIRSENLQTGNNTINLSELSTGVYFIISDSRAVMRFVKQ